MEYIVKNKEIRVIIPASNAGKFRFKKRRNRFDFGETFSTREIPFDEQTYLEWQISYDVPVSEVERGEKKTKLISKEFIGSNGKRKYPYELSEIFYKAIEIGFISKTEVKNLLEEIKSYKNFIGEKPITIEHHSQVIINGISYEETSIKLPTLFMTKTPDNTQIEISIQKQQYATGIQPMIYFCIPFKAFMNSLNLNGKSSTQDDKLEYVINKNNVSNLINLMKVFGMASKRHNHDVIEILKIFLEIL